MELEDRKFVLGVPDSFHSKGTLESFLVTVSEQVENGLLAEGEFELQFINGMAYEELIEKLNLQGFVSEGRENLSPRQVLEQLTHCTAILYIQSAEGDKLIPEKFYDYLALRKYILALVPNSGAFEELVSSEAELFLADIRNYVAISETFLKMYSHWNMRRANQLGAVVPVRELEDIKS